MTQGRVLRSVGLELSRSSRSSRSSAAFVLREAGAADPRNYLVASMVLSSPGCEPFSLWARFLVGPGCEDDLSVSFLASGVCVSDVCSAALPWAPGGRGQSWDDMTGWASSLAMAGMGHPEEAAREAAAFLSGMVLAAVADAWAVSLVRKACAIVAPGRVVELAREACVGQVMEG